MCSAFTKDLPVIKIVLLIILVFVFSYYFSLRFGFHVVFSTYKTMFGSSLPPVVCKRAHVLLTLFVYACGEWCTTHVVLVFCFFFVVVFFVLCNLRCQFLWIVHVGLPLQYSLSFIDISTLNVK
jgi:hypothetical protein